MSANPCTMQAQVAPVAPMAPIRTPSSKLRAIEATAENPVAQVKSLEGKLEASEATGATAK